ncbi:SAHS9 [Ramazzottius varieornatus]|uniref:SAHS9 n=1 Tax=Ramazzottius varieornatus TaxID=947166 RepID=A0A1D1UKG0_RAMVA|nr:SAHS9 [Ramazzottius varieornatus]
MSHPEVNLNSTVLVNHLKKGDEYHHKIIIKEYYTNHVVYKLGEQSPGSYDGLSYSVKYGEKDGALVGTAHYTGTKDQRLNITMHNVYKLEGDRLLKSSTIDGVTLNCHHKRRI